MKYNRVIELAPSYLAGRVPPTKRGVITYLDGNYQIAIEESNGDRKYINLRIKGNKIPAKFGTLEDDLYFTAEGAKRAKNIIKQSPVGSLYEYRIKTKTPQFEKDPSWGFGEVGMK